MAIILLDNTDKDELQQQIAVIDKKGGVYVGSGEMPEGYNIQIDPEGQGSELESLKPVKGVDYFTEEDKAEIVVSVIESLGGNPVFGYVDSDNNIIVSGNLAVGTYSVKYEMEDGNAIDIGELVLDSNVYHSISNNLTNCTNSNTATEVVEGSAYSATISANSGYEITSIIVTMGGTDITSSAVSNGVISISSVTGNIVITAVAEEAVVEIVNMLSQAINSDGTPYNGGQGWETGYRLRSSNGNKISQEGKELTGFIPIKYGQTITIENISLDTSGNSSVCIYNDQFAYLGGSYMSQFMTGSKTEAVNGQNISKKLVKESSATLFNGVDTSAIAYFRFSANEITSESIVYVTD